MTKDTIKRALEAAERDLETLQRNIRKSLADPDYALASLADVSKAIAALSTEQQEQPNYNGDCFATSSVETVQPQEQPIGWQFFDGGRWWYGEDRIKDHRKNTEDAGYPVRDIYAAPVQPQEPTSKQAMAAAWQVLFDAGVCPGSDPMSLADGIRVALSAAPAPVQPASKPIEHNPTNDQIAHVMLMHGTPEQQREALEYAGVVQPASEPEEIEAIAHRWAQAAYAKALGKPFEDIDLIRKELRAAITRCATSNKENNNEA